MLQVYTLLHLYTPFRFNNAHRDEQCIHIYRHTLVHMLCVYIYIHPETFGSVLYNAWAFSMQNTIIRRGDKYQRAQPRRRIQRICVYVYVYVYIEAEEESESIIHRNEPSANSSTLGKADCNFTHDVTPSLSI